MPRDNHFTNGRTLSVLLDQTLSALSAVTQQSFPLGCYNCSSYSFNFVSEGFHLNSIANPFPMQSMWRRLFFSFAYHWPYQWTG